jgi:DNA polymerase elongation subunit (family B)
MPERKKKFKTTELHGRVIDFKEIGRVPNRNAFLDPDKYSRVSKNIKRGKPLLFHSITADADHWQPGDYKKAEFIISLCGVLRDGRKVPVVLEGHKPFFRVLLVDSNYKKFKKGLSVFTKSKLTIKQKIAEIRSVLDEHGVVYEIPEVPVSYHKPFYLYHENKLPYLTIQFRRLKATSFDTEKGIIFRKGAINLLHGMGYETSHNDLNNYHRVICRDLQWSYSDWSVLTKYKLKTHFNKLKKGKTAFFLNYKDFSKYDGPRVQDDIINPKVLSKTWDLETYSKSGNIPFAKDVGTSCFANGQTFQWQYSAKPLLRVIYVDKPSAPHPDYLTIVCRTELNTFHADSIMHSKMQPELIMGFNDMSYDWPWLIERGMKYAGYIADMVYRKSGPYLPKYFNRATGRPGPDFDEKGTVEYNYSTPETIKLEAGGKDMEAFAFTTPGCINIDIRCIYRKLNSTAEKSGLDYFLKKCNLPTKKDMDYHVMFRIYRDSKYLYDEKNQFWTPESLEDIKSGPEFVEWMGRGENAKYLEKGGIHLIDVLMPEDDSKDMKNTKRSKFTNVRAKRAELLLEMREVSEYCVIDAFRCQQLFMKGGIFAFKCMMANLSHGNLYETFYRADSSKVQDLIISRGQAQAHGRGLEFNNISNEKGGSGKFPGAYVVKPVKGLVKPKLTMDERVKKSKIVNEYNSAAGRKLEIRNDMKEWDTVVHDEMDTVYKIIEKHGPTLTEEAMTEIELKEGITLKSHFREFLEEKIGRPIVGLDFSSLYPSLMMTYNFSPEYCVLDKEYAKNLSLRGYKLNRVKFKYNDNMVIGYFVHHENKFDPDSPDYQFGIVPAIEVNLKAERNRIRAPQKRLTKEDSKFVKTVLDRPEWKSWSWEQKKSELKWEKFGWKERIEIMNKETDLFEDPKFRDELAVYEANYTRIDSQQKAVKVYMNTIYGVMGTPISASFLVYFAAGITTMGKRNIKLAGAFVKKHGWGVIYGDTDSIYVYAPESVFREIDILYYTNKITKLEYCTRSVLLTMDAAKKINALVNAMFVKDNGTEFLVMAYEEVLYPAAYLAKKKYFGVEHEKVPNFNWKHLFIKGLEIIKRGSSQILKKVCGSVMEDCMDLDNLFSLMELCLMQVEAIYNAEWEFDDFIKTAAYRPNKDNKSVKLLVARMKEIGIKVPVGERFKFVVVEKYPYKYDPLRGKKIDLKVGDRMELYERAKKMGMKIDLDYYMKGGIIGQFATLIAYHPKFHINSDAETDKELDVVEAKIRKNGGKFMTAVFKSFYKKYTKKGGIYQAVYKMSAKITNTKIARICKNKTVNDFIGSSWDDGKKNFENWVNTKTKSRAVAFTKLKKSRYEVKRHYTQIYRNFLNTPIGRKYNFKCKKAQRNVLGKILVSNYLSKNGVIARLNSESNRCLMEIKQRLIDSIGEFKKVKKTYNQITGSVVEGIRDILDVDDQYREPSAVIPEFSQLANYSKLDSVRLDKIADEEYDKIDKESMQKSVETVKKIYNDLIVVNMGLEKNRLLEKYMRGLVSKKSRIVDERDECGVADFIAGR